MAYGERIDLAIEVADLARSAPTAVLVAALLRATSPPTLEVMRELLRDSSGEGRGESGRCV